MTIYDKTSTSRNSCITRILALSKLYCMYIWYNWKHVILYYYDTNSWNILTDIIFIFFWEKSIIYTMQYDWPQMMIYLITKLLWLLRFAVIQQGQGGADRNIGPENCGRNIREIDNLSINSLITLELLTTRLYLLDRP